MLVLMDGDLVVTDEWVKEVLSCRHPSAGYGRINWLSEEGTALYLKSKHIDRNLFNRSRTPSRGGAAGGVTIVPREIFYSLSGIPEDFIGSWGGEDNAFWSKLVQMGHNFRSLTCTITHLHHSKTTPQIRVIQKKALPMFYWNRLQWEEHIKQSSESWGARTPSEPPESFEFLAEKSDAKLTIAMLSWIRPDKLVQTLTSLDEILTIPVNLTLMVQGSETLSLVQRRVIKELASRFYRSDVFFTKGNIGTGPARSHLINRAMTRFHTPFYNFGDDDTTYVKGSIEAAIKLMEEDYSIGVVGIRYKPNIYRAHRTIYPRYIELVKATSSIEYVDSTGSASAIIRREVFDLCEVDSKYKIGQWDLDLFLQARSVGWKIVNYQAFGGMRAINNWGGSPEYRAGRMNRKEINKSINRFKQKWGLLKAI